jgi:hypothetical protein
MSQQIDEEKKRLYESMIHIASEDQFKLLHELVIELYNRHQIIKHGRLNDLDKEYLADLLRHHNERIKKLLML